MELEVMSLVFQHIFSLKGLLLLLTGTILGLIMGVVPGMGAMTTLALLLPFTFGWNPLDAFILLSAVFGATTVGGSVSAILINVPGTPENIMTTVDGYALTKRGKAVEALALSGFSSFFGSLIGVILFVILLPILRPISVAFGPPEIFWLAIFALVVLSTSTGGSFITNMLVGGFAFVLSLHGLGPVAGIPRFSHNIPYLWGGIPLIAALVGTFAIPEVIQLISKTRVTKRVTEETLGGSRLVALKEIFKNKFLVIRSSILGFIIGVIPGVGGTLANYLAYAQAVQTSKDTENFGKGEPRGIIAPESANNAKDVGQLVPTLSLGIPGSGTMTVFLGALILHGITPGPFVLRDHFDVVIVVLLTFVVGFMISCLSVAFGGKYFSKVLNIDQTLLGVGVLTICFVAIYFVRYEILDVFTMLVFGLIGFAVMKMNGSRILLVLPLVIGPIIEHNLITSLQVCRGDYWYFFSPISIAILILTALSVFGPLKRRREENDS